MNVSMNMKCDNCGAHKTTRVYEMKQLLKKSVVFAIALIIVLLWFLNTGSLVALMVLPFAFIYGIVYLVSVGKKEKFINYKCTVCGNKFKVKNLRYKK